MVSVICAVPLRSTDALTHSWRTASGRLATAATVTASPTRRLTSTNTSSEILRRWAFSMAPTLRGAPWAVAGPRRGGQAGGRRSMTSSTRSGTQKGR